MQNADSAVRMLDTVLFICRTQPCTKLGSVILEQCNKVIGRFKDAEMFLIDQVRPTPPF